MGIIRRGWGRAGLPGQFGRGAEDLARVLRRLFADHRANRRPLERTRGALEGNGDDYSSTGTIWYAGRFESQRLPRAQLSR